MTWYVVLIGLVVVERMAEVVVANRNRTWSRTQGGIEFGAGHYPVMVTLHTALPAACLLEPMLLNRYFIPALGWPMLAIVIAAQELRWWCITAPGRQWNTRVIVIPGAARIAGGPWALLAPELRRSGRRGPRIAPGPHGVAHRAGVLRA
jgi:methyltransferase